MGVKRQQRQRLKRLHVNRMIPNFLTLLALCAGLSAVRFALQGRWEHAAIAILAAAILDGLDGRIARILKGSSRFGAELDSLSDFVSFGVAPAIMIYLWSLKDSGRFAWFLVLFYAICAALRLARFNTALEDPNPPAWTCNYFTGVPSPVAAGLVLLPLGLSFLLDEILFRHPSVTGFFLIFVGVLMVSTIPTYAFKKFKVPPAMLLPTMMIAGLIIAGLISAPWVTLVCILVFYLLSMPFSRRSYRLLKKQNEEAEASKGEISPSENLVN